MDQLKFSWCAHLLASFPAAGLLIGQGGLRGRGLGADSHVSRALAFTRVVEVARLGCIQTRVTGLRPL